MFVVLFRRQNCRLFFRNWFDAIFFKKILSLLYFAWSMISLIYSNVIYFMMWSWTRRKSFNLLAKKVAWIRWWAINNSYVLLCWNVFFFYSFLLRTHFVILKLTTIFDKGCGRWKFSAWLQSAERSSGIMIADSNWHLFSNTYSFNPTQSFSHNISVSSYNMFLLHICNFLCFCYDFWMTNKLKSEHDVY